MKRIIRRADDDVPKDAAQKETDTVALVSKRVSLAKKWVKQTTTKDGIEVWTRENGTTENPIKEIRATVTFEDVSPLNFGSGSRFGRVREIRPLRGTSQSTQNEG